MRPDDLLEYQLANAPAQAGEGRAEVRFAIDATASAAATSAPAEPQFAPTLLVEFEEADRLDPARATVGPEEPPPPPRYTASRLGLAGAVGIHLLPLLLLVTWPVTPSETTPPISVQLVVLKEPEPPQPAKPPEVKPPQPTKPPEVKPPSGRLASVDIGDPAAPHDKPEAEAEPAPESPKETEVAAVPPPSPPPPPPPKPPTTGLVSALPKPTPAPEPDLKPAEPPPEPSLPPKSAVKERVTARLTPPPHPAPHPGDVPGPSASRNEYLVYCMALVRQHYALLPPSFLAGRYGITVVNILVLGNGTIARVDVARHSGYPDIDGRVEQMIAAVRRFPPLPQWIQRSSITMTYELTFPEGLQER